jgi:signal transduction histidine kinase
MTLAKAWARSRQRFNGTRPRIFVGYILLTAFTSVASLLSIHHILHGRIRDQSEIYVARQIEAFRSTIGQQRFELNGSVTEQVTAILNEFLTQYAPIDADDYAIAFLQGQVYQYTDLFPTGLLAEDAALIQQWAQVTQSQQGSVDTSVGALFYFAEPITFNGKTQGVLVVVHCADGIHELIDGALLLIISATLGVIAIASGIAWVTAGRVLAPLRTLTQTAQSVTESEMTQRIHVKGTDDVAQMTMTFNDMLDRLQIAFESQQAFLNDAGHELRTPITIIRGYLETLQYRPDRQEQTLALALDELDRMGRLVNELLLLAKADHPDFLKPKLEELDWLTEALYLKAQSMADRQWGLESKGLTPIRLDHHRITQAVMNLVQNAIRHTQEDDAIMLGSSVQGTMARIWVRDTGEGIAAEDLTRIFNRFTRGTAREDPNENYGLGLSIVQAIAHAHGGWVDLESQLGQGSTFTLVIPLDPVPDGVTRDTHSDHRRQPPHHRFSGVRPASSRIPDHRR